MTHRIRTFAVLGVASLALSACHKKKPAEVPAPVVKTPIIERPNTPTPPPRINTGPDSATLERERAARAEAAKAAAIASLTAKIYFDYDKAELRDDARATLDAKAPVLRQFASVRIRIAGHTDERGSAEYNMALGQKRAAAARRYLVGLGIAESRIDVVSFGEERPVVMGEGEETWGKNRRGEFEIVAGADQIRPSGA